MGAFPLRRNLKACVELISNTKIKRFQNKNLHVFNYNIILSCTDLESRKYNF